MKIMLIYGQCLGLLPVSGIFEKDVTKMRYRWFTWKVFYSLAIGFLQGTAAILCVENIINLTFTIRGLAHIFFYLITCSCTFMFLRVAVKWPSLMKELYNCGLQYYIDPKTKSKCHWACYFILFLAIYIFIICISIYLSSILNSIIKKIDSVYKNNYLPPSFWRSLREDYNRATQLVRSFDDSISGVVFISYANNMFFICLQLYYSLGNGLKGRQNYFRTACPNYPSGPFGGYEASIYLIYTVAFIFSKFLAVSLITSDVHTSSMKAAPALYNIASSMYCEEIQRFLDQVHSDTVALSGFQFFYVTREIILSVVGTIVTYELVMLQFGS
ncbi:gustatory receptor for sugar taste 64f [Manduca sexta]|nr:gustatory receptor for sugar taste 64f [Manduca sexta]